MEKLPSIIIIKFNDLTNIVESLEFDNEFPTIDIDSLLAIVIDLFNNNVNILIENALQYLMSNDLINDRIDLEAATLVKLESIIYKLLIIVQSTFHQLMLNDNILKTYRYKCRRSNNVLFERDRLLHSARNIDN